MRSRPWLRDVLIAEVRDQLWRYLTPAASVEKDLLEASALLKLRPRDLRTLGRLQFLISDEVAAVLEAMPHLSRRLATTTASEEEWSAERIRGAIQWGRTLGVRYATGNKHLYVTAPARRAFQTAENELLVLVLDAIVSLGNATGWNRAGSTELGALIASRVDDATRWGQLRALLEVERRPVTALKVARIRAGRHRRRYASVLAAYERYRLLADRLDRRSIRAAVETYGLVTRDDPTIMELLCTFRILRGLRRRGWDLSRLGLLHGSLHVVARREDATLDIYYQSVPRELSQSSSYRLVQREHGIPPGSLRPDLVVKARQGENTRWLLVEVKGGERPVDRSARAAIYDLLAYRSAFGVKLEHQAAPYGLAVAWGEELDPHVSQGICVSTPDRIDAALAAVGL